MQEIYFSNSVPGYLFIRLLFAPYDQDITGPESVTKGKTGQEEAPS